MTLRGMTWDHPRAHRPLAAFAGLGRGPAVAWDRQSLADFESFPVAELARRYDLLVVDHPGLGAALRDGALLPLDRVVDPATLDRWQRAAVGRTWASYTVDGRQWAAPIDAATQVSVLRADLDGPAPTDWAGVVQLAGRVGTTLCLGGPHAFLGLLAMCASATDEPGENPDAVGELLEPTAAATALDVLRAVWARADQAVSLGDPITVHEALAARSDLQYCPLAYGYAAYARPAAAGRAPLRWADAPGFGSARPGTVLGGTGLALSARSGADPGELAAFLTAFLDDDVQSGLVPSAGGQPAARSAWDDPAVDAAWGGYYSATRRSVEQAHIRPRLPGWIGLQERASDLVRAAVTGQEPPATVVARINADFRALAGERAGASA
jgi:multiple sugar transport system substrate-binding protein